MGTWDHRITREQLTTGEYMFAIREVYYDHDGQPDGWTADPIAALGESPGEVADTLHRMIESLERGVLDLETRRTLPMDEALG